MLELEELIKNTNPSLKYVKTVAFGRFLVDRNKIKRQMHAIYFNNLELFLEKPTKAIALTYVSKSPTSFAEIKKSMTTLFSII